LETHKKAADAIMDEIAWCRFDKAQSMVDSMIAADSSELLYRMLLLSTIALRQLDIAESSGHDDFAPAYEQTMQRLAILDKNGPIRESYFLTMKGFIQLVAAAHAMQRKSYFKGLHLGLDAVSLCRGAKAIDSADEDADFVLGLYNYARAELKRKFLGILFWYPGDKPSGIAAMERCSATAKIIGPTAAMVLQEIYVREGMYDKATEGIDRMLIRYPRCRFVLWSKAKMYDAQKAWAMAAQTYGDLADAYAALPRARENASLTRWLQAQRYYQAADANRARTACGLLLSMCKSGPCEQCREAEALVKKIDKAR
jgi:tetratricopeptide (TPR) repeat protein